MGKTGIQKGNLKTSVRIHEHGTTGCDNEPQDTAYQQSQWWLFEYISCISLMPHSSEKGRGGNSRNPVFPAKRRHIVRSQDGETAPLWLFLSQVLQITPESGVVQPGESIPCFVTLQPSGSASSYSIDVVCEVRPKRYLCIATTWACPCSSQMAGHSGHVPATSS